MKSAANLGKTSFRFLFICRSGVKSGVRAVRVAGSDPLGGGGGDALVSDS